MAATATKKSSSSGSKTKTTARSVQKTPDKKQSPEGAAINDLREKRAAMDQPVVDTPVAVLSGGETETLEDKDRIEIVPEGSSAKVSIGNKSVTLDGEGVKSLQRHLSAVAAGF